MSSQKQWKRRFYVRSLCTHWSLSHVSFRVEKFGVHWKITERSLGDRWDHWVLVECSLSIQSAFIQHSLRDHFPWRPLRDYFGLSQYFKETMVTVEIIWRSLTDHWEILAISGSSFKDRCEIWPFFLLLKNISTITKRGLRDPIRGHAETNEVIIIWLIKWS